MIRFLMQTLLIATATAWAPPPDAVRLEVLLEKTIFQVDVIALDLWLGPTSVAQVRRLCATPEEAAADAGRASRDSLAAIIASSRDARVRVVFQRDVSLDRFLDGVITDMRRAQGAGLLGAEGFQHVASGLPVWLAPLRAEGLHEGDRFLYRIAGDTLRTRVERAGGAVVIDQTDVGVEHRRALLGSLVAPGGGFTDQLLDQLPRRVCAP
ncbi:hypothetical protein GF314_11310 [bacterium]|nr:hypothetical protein [bacterium]